MKLYLFMCFFFFFVFGKPLKDFPFYSPILVTLWFRYLQTRIKESLRIFLVNFFFKIPRQMHITEICWHKFHKFSVRCSLYGATQRSHWTKSTVKKINLLGKTAVNKNAWIKAWVLDMSFHIWFIMTLHYTMQPILLQNATAILWQNATEVYYTMRQVFYCKIRQLLQNARILLQNATFITNCDSTWNMINLFTCVIFEWNKYLHILLFPILK